MHFNACVSLFFLGITKGLCFGPAFLVPRLKLSVLSKQDLVSRKSYVPLHASKRELPSDLASTKNAFATELELFKEDSAVYTFLAVSQLLPLVSTSRVADLFYFAIMACSTVYLGTKRQDIPGLRQALSTSQASLAPIVSSVSLFGLYLLLKYTGFDPSFVYRYGATFVGASAGIGISSFLLTTFLPSSLSSIDIPLPKFAQKLFSRFSTSTEGRMESANLPLPNLIAIFSVLVSTGAYLFPGSDLHRTFIVSNYLAWCIGMQSIGLITVQNFLTVCVFLGGLFLYDIYWVFFSDVMVTVATKIEAPVKFIFPLPDSMARDYPFAVLGLGDIVIPAIAISLLRNLDKFLVRQDMTSQNSEESSNQRYVYKRAGKYSYFDMGVLSYALGLGACFIGGAIMGKGQPALLYLSPAVIVSGLLTAALNNEFSELFSFKQDSIIDDEAVSLNRRKNN